MSFDTVFTISTSILQMAQNVKANKDRCLRVARRVKALEQLVMAIQNKGPGFGSMTVNNALVDLCITLEEAKKIMEKYSKTKGMMGFLKSGSIEDKFSGVNERLSDSFQILSGALQIEQNHKLCRLFDPVSEESIYENEDDGWLQPTAQMFPYPQLSTPVSSPTPQMSPYPQVSSPISQMSPYPSVSSPTPQMSPYPSVSSPTPQMSPYPSLSSPSTQMSPYGPVSGQTGPWHFTMPMSPPATPSLTSPSTIVYNTCTQVSTSLSKRDLSQIPFQGTATPTCLSTLPSSGQNTPTSVTYYMVKR